MNSKIKSESKVCKVFEKSFGPQKPSVSPFISSISAIGRVPKMENAIIRVWFSTFHSSPSVAIGTCFRSQVAPWVSMMLLLPLFCSGFKPATNMFNASVINRSRQQKMLIPCEWLLDFHGLLSFIFICNGMVIDQRVYHGITIIYWWYTYPSEKWWSLSVGMMKFPIYGKKTCSKPPTRFTMEFHSMIIFDPEFHRWSRTTLRALVVAQCAPSFLTDLEARPTSLRCRDGGQSDFWGSKVGMLENHRDKVGYVQDTMKIPSGKRLHNYGKSPLLMGKSTISMAMFKFANC